MHTKYYSYLIFNNRNLFVAETDQYAIVLSYSLYNELHEFDIVNELFKVTNTNYILRILQIRLYKFKYEVKY